MNRPQTALLVSGVLAIVCIGVLALPDSPETLEIPAALSSTNVEIPEEQNNLTHLLGILGKTTPEQTAKLRDAIDRLKSGKGIEDQALLDELLRVHELTDGMLKPPLAFSQNGQLVAIGLFRMFQGAEVLARQAMFENDYQRADRILGDLLRWSRLLRNAQPNQVQWIVSRSGWKMAFDALLQELPEHPEKLDEIERLSQENRVEIAELAECLKMEARWWKAHGGLKALLDEPDSYLVTVFFKPPFNELSVSDLRALPYDVQADFRRDINDMLGMLECLKRNAPIKEWPGFDISASGRTLDDYRRRPNGLGDLFYEQKTPEIQVGFWNSALSHDRLLEACLLWLKTERGGEVVTVDLFKGFLDPVDGNPMSIDVKQRTIRSRGRNMNVDTPDAGAAPMPEAGFRVCGDDVVIVVPRWNTVSAAKPEDP